MTTQKCLTGMAVLCLAGALSATGADRKVATAELKDAKGQTVGQVKLKQGKNAVTLSAKVTGRRLPQWQETNGDAAPMPESPVASATIS